MVTRPAAEIRITIGNTGRTEPFTGEGMTEFQAERIRVLAQAGAQFCGSYSSDEFARRKPGPFMAVYYLDGILYGEWLGQRRVIRTVTA